MIKGDYLEEETVWMGFKHQKMGFHGLLKNTIPTSRHEFLMLRCEAYDQAPSGRS